MLRNVLGTAVAAAALTVLVPVGSANAQEYLPQFEASRSGASELACGALGDSLPQRTFNGFNYNDEPRIYVRGFFTTEENGLRSGHFQVYRATNNFFTGFQREEFMGYVVMGCGTL